MDAKGEAENAAHVVMTCSRHIGLLGKLDFERESAVLEQVAKYYSRSSLQYAMTLNWTAACGLGVDSPSIQLAACKLAQQSIAVSGAFGHQATVAQLLALTPELGLDFAVRRDWIRQALYFNAFRQH
jgi:hypothetical protein